MTSRTAINPTIAPSLWSWFSICSIWIPDMIYLPVECTMFIRVHGEARNRIRRRMCRNFVGEGIFSTLFYNLLETIFVSELHLRF